MSDRYPGGMITKTPVVPAGPYEDGAAPGIWTLEQQAYYKAQGLWPLAGNPNPGDPYYKYVTMLLTGDGTNGAQNNTFLDSSSNAFSITRNGNTTQGSFSPYGSLWSNYFNGSSNLIYGQNSAFELGTGDFTIECWVQGYVYNENRGLICYRDSGGSWSQGAWMLLDTNGGIGFYTYQGGFIVTATIASTNVNLWNHVAFVRQSGVMKAYINGVLSETNSSSNASQSFNGNGSPQFRVGSQYDNSGEHYYNGVISNLRIVKSAVYTSSFTPSTTPLTAISNTTFLSCQSNRFIDNSSNNLSYSSSNGSVVVQRFSPFNPTASYDTATIGGSGYFDGDGDYLSVPSSSAWNFGTGDFTLSSWIYPTTSDTGWQHTIFKVSSLQMFVYNNSLYFNGGGQFNYGSSIKPFAWNYVEICRASGTLYFFINGILVGSTGNSTDFSSTSGGYIGWNSGAGYVFGYLSDCRIIKGTALHTSSYTSPTAPVTSVTNTQLLANFTNAGIFDSAMRNDWITNNTAQISTSVKKFGTGSMWFDSSIASSHLQIPMGILNTALNASTFTIETWVYRTTGGGSYQCILSGNSDTMDIVVNGSNMFITSNTSNGTHIIDGAYTQYLPVNTWVHLALVCQEGTYYLYFDGINRATGTGATGNNNRSTDYTTNYTYWLGARGDMYGIGYLDDFRITTGIARYPNGTTFTPPTTAFYTY